MRRAQATQGKILTFQLQPMPADTARGRFISAGWLLSEMDKACGRRAHDYIIAGDPPQGGRAVTVGIEAMAFRKPVYVGDLVRIYTEVVRQGKSSITIHAESWSDRRDQTTEKVTEGFFTFVAIDKDRHPVPVQTNRDLQNPILSSPAAVAPRGKASAPPSLQPSGTLIKTLKPTRRNTNWLGDVFGGWILSRMDESCVRFTAGHTSRKVANVGIESMTFHKPVAVGDEVGFYADLAKIGTTSMAIRIETWARRAKDGRHEKVTEGLFTYVALDKNRRPAPLLSP